jgi:sensor histidine kinase YesM
MGDIGYLFYAYIADFLKLWIFFRGIYSLPSVKKKNVYIILAVLQSVMIVVLGMFRKENGDLVTLIWTCTLILIICFYFEGSFVKKVAYSILAYLVSLFLDAGIGALSTNVVKNLVNEKHYTLVTLIYNILNIFTLSVISWLKRSINKSSSPLNISKRIYALLFAGSGAGVFIILALIIRSNENIPEIVRRAMVIVTIIIVIAYCTACLMMTVITESRDNYKALSMISQNTIESQQKYYTLVNEKQLEIRSIRHEMKNHLACIYGLYKADKLKEMEEYINQIIDTSNQTAELIDTGNDIVNAILNDAQSRYKSENIEIRLEGGFQNSRVISVKSSGQRLR